MAPGIFVKLVTGGAALWWVKRARQPIPWTGRKHVVVLPERLEQVLADHALKGLLKEHRDRKSNNMFARFGNRRKDAQRHQDEEYVHKVGNKVLRALESEISGDLVKDDKGQCRRASFANDGYVGHLSRCKWSFLVIDEKEPNACVLPNGTVIVHTGLLDLLGRDGPEAEARLSFVLGHELGHCCARHYAERTSASFILICFIKLVSPWALRKMRNAWGGGDGNSCQLGVTVTTFRGIQADQPDAVVVNDMLGEVKVFEVLSDLRCAKADDLLDAWGEPAWLFAPAAGGGRRPSLCARKKDVVLTEPTVVYHRGFEGGPVVEHAVWYPTEKRLRAIVRRWPPCDRSQWLVVAYKSEEHRAGDGSVVVDLWQYCERCATANGARGDEGHALVDAAQDLFFNLPMSRKHEHEADLIGVKLSALAGYDPR